MRRRRKRKTSLTKRDMMLEILDLVKEVAEALIVSYLLRKLGM